MQWASQVTTIGLEMALPPAGGWWLDERWGTEPWLLIAGAVLGFAAGMLHLLQLVGPPGKNGSQQKRDAKRGDEHRR